MRIFIYDPKKLQFAFVFDSLGSVPNFFGSRSGSGVFPIVGSGSFLTFGFRIFLGSDPDLDLEFMRSEPDPVLFSRFFGSGSS